MISKAKLEFLCNHANAFVLYVLEETEYIIEVSLQMSNKKIRIIFYNIMGKIERIGLAILIDLILTLLKNGHGLSTQKFIKLKVTILD